MLLGTRHVKAALSAMTVKTDRRDARGIAQLLKMGGTGYCSTGREAKESVEALVARPTAAILSVLTRRSRSQNKNPRRCRRI